MKSAIHLCHKHRDHKADRLLYGGTCLIWDGISGGSEIGKKPEFLLALPPPNVQVNRKCRAKVSVRVYQFARGGGPLGWWGSGHQSTAVPRCRSQIPTPPRPGHPLLALARSLTAVVASAADTSRRSSTRLTDRYVFFSQFMLYGLHRGLDYWMPLMLLEEFYVLFSHLSPCSRSKSSGKAHGVWKITVIRFCEHFFCINIIYIQFWLCISICPRSFTIMFDRLEGK